MGPSPAPSVPRSTSGRAASRSCGCRRKSRRTGTSAPIRWVGILTLVVTVLKVFLVDLSTLGGAYRVVGFLVVGLLLLAVSYLYQRRRAPAAHAEPALVATSEAADPAPPPA